MKLHRYFTQSDDSENMDKAAGQSLSSPTSIHLADVYPPWTATKPVSLEVGPPESIPTATPSVSTEVETQESIPSPDFTFVDSDHGNLIWLNPNGIWSNSSFTNYCVISTDRLNEFSP